MHGKSESEVYGSIETTSEVDRAIQNVECQNDRIEGTLNSGYAYSIAIYVLYSIYKEL